MLKKTTTGLLAGTGAVALGTAAGRPAAADAAAVATPDWISVVSHGADPSGSADSAPAIQAAINALPATGGVIYLPAGTYKLASTVTCTTVPVSWAFDIAAKTAVTSGETIVTLPSGYHYTDNKILPGNLSGAAMTANQYAPGYVTATGAFEYNGPAFSSAGTAWWYGQGIYTLSLG